MILMFENFNYSGFYDALSNALYTFTNLFNYLIQIINSFLTRCSSSDTIISSFIVILFGIAVVSACITVWRH